MISFDNALEIVLGTKVSPRTENINLNASLGKTLAEDIVSDLNMPPFDKAAMDGFAIRESDITKELTIIETVAAGQNPLKKIKEGEATKIMTGAPVPEGADFVIQVELSEIIANEKVRFTGHPNNNIIPFAEDVKTGDIVLFKGQKIEARHMAVMAAVGCTYPLVYASPIVGIISTGNEIVEPEFSPKTSQIRNSNATQLIGQVLQCGASPLYFGIAPDTYDTTYNTIQKGLEACDILLISGGVSMGDFDYVPKIMHDLGIIIHFDKVAVQPGKPTTFGTKGNKVIIGLPGNPVSSFVQFEFLVKPLLNKWMGKSEAGFLIKLPLEKSYRRKKSDRKAFIPITISAKSTVIASEYHGSAHIFALPHSHGFAIINEGTKELNEGDLVDVRLF